MKYKIIWEGDSSHGEKDDFNSVREAEDWALENLPYGILKCRTGTYEIVYENE